MPWEFCSSGLGVCAFGQNHHTARERHVFRSKTGFPFVHDSDPCVPSGSYSTSFLLSSPLLFLPPPSFSPCLSAFFSASLFPSVPISPNNANAGDYDDDHNDFKRGRQNERTHATQLDENHELVWDDGVAPEVTIDFDAPHISMAEGLAWWGGGFAFFAAVFGLVTVSDPESKREAVPRSATLPATAFDPRDLFKTEEAAAEDGEEDEEDEEEEEE